MSRVVLVTGGSRGIGRAIVEHFVRSGDKVATCARTLDALKDSLAQHTMACDVGDAQAVERFVAEGAKVLGPIDVVVNNAGIAGDNHLTGAPKTRDAEDAAWHEMVRVNLAGPYNVLQSSLRHMPSGGRIVNVASILGLVGVADQPASCSTKHALVGLTRSMALALAPRRITVNAVCPGWVDTDMAQARASELSTSTEVLGAHAPLGRMARPDEVAALVAYCASDAAALMTGQTLTLDGGATL